MNDKSILLKLFLLTLFIGNISMNLVGEENEPWIYDLLGSLGEVEKYGFLSHEDAIDYLDKRPELKNYNKLGEPGKSTSSLLPEQNMARWALGQVNREHVNQELTNGKLNREELYNALIWLIGVADGRLEDWLMCATKWPDYHIFRPAGSTARNVRFYSPDPAAHYNWYKTAVANGNNGGSIYAIAAYWGHVLSRRFPGSSSAGGSTLG